MAESEQFTSSAPTGGQGPASQLPPVNLPKGGGAIRGMGEKFATNPVTGTASLSVPLGISPGRSGFGPELTLSYDSGAGNGPFGLGWTLSVSSITRKTDKGLPRYGDAEDSDVYLMSGAEDLVAVLQPDGQRFKDDTTAPGFVIHRYRPRIEGTFARIERWTNVAKDRILNTSPASDLPFRPLGFGRGRIFHTEIAKITKAGSSMRHRRADLPSRPLGLAAGEFSHGDRKDHKEGS